jgi:hypothetical protein
MKKKKLCKASPFSIFYMKITASGIFAWNFSCKKELIQTGAVWLGLPE